MDVQEVYGYAWQQEGPTVIVRLGDVFAGQMRNVLWKLSVPGKTGRVDMGELALRYQDLNAGKRRSATSTLSVDVTRDRDIVSKHRDDEVAARIAEIELATSMQKAALLVEQGRYEDARQELQKATSKARATSRQLGAAGGGLSDSAEEAEALSDDLAAPPAAASERKAMVKKSKAGAYKLRKK